MIATKTGKVIGMPIWKVIGTVIWKVIGTAIWKVIGTAIWKVVGTAIWKVVGVVVEMAAGKVVWTATGIGIGMATGKVVWTATGKVVEMVTGKVVWMATGIRIGMATGIEIGTVSAPGSCFIVAPGVCCNCHSWRSGGWCRAPGGPAVGDIVASGGWRHCGTGWFAVIVALAVAVIVSPGGIMSCCCHSWRSDGGCIVTLGGPAVADVIVTPGCLEIAVIVTDGPAVDNIFAPKSSCQLQAVVSLMLRVFDVVVTPGGPAVGVVLLAVRRL